MNRLALALVAVLASSVVACAAESTDETVTTPAAAEEEPTSQLEAKPHSAPAATPEENAPQAEGAFAVERIGEKRIVPTPTPKPGVGNVGELPAFTF